jgi:hypothetical protein
VNIHPLFRFFISVGWLIYLLNGMPQVVKLAGDGDLSSVSGAFVARKPGFTTTSSLFTFESRYAISRVGSFLF